MHGAHRTDHRGSTTTNGGIEKGPLPGDSWCCCWCRACAERLCKAPVMFRRLLLPTALKGARTRQLRREADRPAANKSPKITRHRRRRTSNGAPHGIRVYAGDQACRQPMTSVDDHGNDSRRFAVRRRDAVDTYFSVPEGRLNSARATSRPRSSTTDATTRAARKTRTSHCTHR